MKAASSSLSSSSNKAMAHNPPHKLHYLLDPDSPKYAEQAKPTLNDPHRSSPPYPAHRFIHYTPQEILSMGTAMSSQGGIFTLVDILDQAFEAPNIGLDLRRESIRTLQRICGPHTILPRTCTLSEYISKGGNIPFTSGPGFTDVWKGHHNGNRVCIKAFRIYTTEGLSEIKQRLFQEIATRRRISHPNILPVLGVSQELVPLCVITERMTDGNIVDFTSGHPKVNPLCLLAEATSGLQYLHSMGIIHNDLKPMNILIGPNFHPRLPDYGVIAIPLGPPTSNAAGGMLPVGYMAPSEPLNPFAFGPKDSNLTKESDVHALGVTMHQSFSETNGDTITYEVVTGERPGFPPIPNERTLDDTHKFISRFRSPSRDDRPDVNFMMNALNDAADAIEIRRRNSHSTTNEQGARTVHRVSGILPLNRDLLKPQSNDTPIQRVPQRSPSTSSIPETQSSSVTGTPVASRAPCGNENNRSPKCGMLPPVYIDQTHYLWVTEPEFFAFPR